MRRVIRMLVVTGMVPTILSLATLITFLSRSDIWQSKPVMKYLQLEFWYSHLYSIHCDRTPVGTGVHDYYDIRSPYSRET